MRQRQLQTTSIAIAILFLQALLPPRLASASCPAGSTLDPAGPTNIEHNTQSFAYTGTVVQYTLAPPEANYIQVFLWGAGGGNALQASGTPCYAGNGGAGGFVWAGIGNLASGASFSIEVGQRGRRAGQLPSNYASSWNDGGAMCKGSYYYQWQPASGGGSTRIYLTGTDPDNDALVVAGGGGGGGCSKVSYTVSDGGYAGVSPDPNKPWTPSSTRQGVTATNTHATYCVTPSGGGGLKGGGYSPYTSWWEFKGAAGGTSGAGPSAAFWINEDDTGRTHQAQGQSHKTTHAVPAAAGDANADGYAVVVSSTIQPAQCICNTQGERLNDAETACVPCTPGFYCPTSTNPNTEITCPGGKTSNAGADSEDACYCIQGAYFDTNSQSCVPCAAGTKYCPGRRK